MRNSNKVSIKLVDNIMLRILCLYLLIFILFCTVYCDYSKVQYIDVYS